MYARKQEDTYVKAIGVKINKNYEWRKIKNKKKN